MLWNMHVISSKGIPADVTGGDDVATRKYKSTCGEGGGSFLLFSTFTFYIYIYAFSRRFYPKWLTVNSGYTFFCQYICVPWESNVCTSYLLLFVPIYIMATGKQDKSDKQHFRLCASPHPRFITGGDTLCALLAWERGMLGQLLRELTVLIVFACLCSRRAERC